MAVPKSEWEWFGFAGHLCVASRCRFHMLTKVGDYLVSTVGAYFQDKDDTEMTDIGFGRKYETFVFRVGGMCDCGCGQPEISGEELETRGANNAISSREQHLELCKLAAEDKIGLPL